MGFNNSDFDNLNLYSQEMCNHCGEIRICKPCAECMLELCEDHIKRSDHNCFSLT